MKRRFWRLFLCLFAGFRLKQMIPMTIICTISARFAETELASNPFD